MAVLSCHVSMIAPTPKIRDGQVFSFGHCGRLVPLCRKRNGGSMLESLDRQRDQNGDGRPDW
jgi:hypothetical protein